MNKYINLFKSYQWNKLYNLVKLVEYNSAIPIQNQHDLAIKAMLLVSWWSDSISAKEILKHYPPIIKDPLTHFAVTYAYISLGDKVKLKHYISKKPKGYPKWMENYLELEYCGRSLQFEKQVSLVRKLTPKNQFPQNYIKVALLQSLEHEKADIKFLKSLLEEMSLKNDKDPLSIALCVRSGITSLDDIDDTTTFPLLLERKASYSLLKSDCLNALKLYDALANTGFLDINSINRWLALSISLPQAKEYYLQRVDFAVKLVPNSLFVQGTIASYAIIFAWLSGDYKLAYNIAKQYHSYQQLPKNNFTKNAIIFFSYIIRLCIEWQNSINIYDKSENDSKLFVYGESHNLSLANVNFILNNLSFCCNSNFVMGIKMYHLANTKSSYHSACLLEYFKFIKSNSDLFFTIGEIDTRPDEGIWQVHLKKEKPVDEIIEDTVNGYINFLYENLKDKQTKSVTIQGIPAPNYALEGDKDPKDETGFLQMIKQVNEKLKELTLEKGWNFLDVYNATVGEDGKSNKKWHIDGYHLSPVFYPSEADKWLIKPKVQEDPKPTTIDFSKHQTVSLSKPSQL